MALRCLSPGASALPWPVPHAHVINEAYLFVRAYIIVPRLSEKSTPICRANPVVGLTVLPRQAGARVRLRDDPPQRVQRGGRQRAGRMRGERLAGDLTRRLDRRRPPRLDPCRVRPPVEHARVPHPTKMVPLRLRIY